MGAHQTVTCRHNLFCSPSMHSRKPVRHLYNSIAVPNGRNADHRDIHHAARAHAHAQAAAHTSSALQPKANGNVALNLLPHQHQRLQHPLQHNLRSRLGTGRLPGPRCLLPKTPTWVWHSAARTIPLRHSANPSLIGALWSDLSGSMPVAATKTAVGTLKSSVSGNLLL